MKHDPRQVRPVIGYWGVAVLVVGMLSAVLIAMTATDDETDAASAIATDRMYQHNLELMGGKFGVLLAEFSDWFASLWHGRALAYTVGVVSIAIAAACFLLARLMKPPRQGAAREHGQP
jgi:hypothetical protein